MSTYELQLALISAAALAVIFDKEFLAVACVAGVVALALWGQP